MPLAQVSAAAHPLTDRELAKRIAAGDQDELQRLMRRFNQRLYRTARSILRDDAEAEDAVQESYLLAYRAMARFRGDAKLSTWLVRIVANEALGRLRKRGRRAELIQFSPAPEPASDDPELSVTDAPPEQPEDAAIRAQMRVLLEAKIDQLPDAFRVVFVLRAVEDMTAEEAGACLGIPAATVRTRYFRAKGLLRESLAREIDVSTQDAFRFDGERCDRIVAGVLKRLKNSRIAKQPGRGSKLFASLALIMAIIPGVLLAPGIRAESFGTKDDLVEKHQLTAFDGQILRNLTRSFVDGQSIFRFDTFGDEAFWGDALKLHQAVQGERFGGVGPGLAPRAALMLGLKVDADVLPRSLRRDIENGRVNLDDPAVTLALLRLDAVVGVKGFFDNGRMRAIGITCALCHSTVDNALAAGIGHRLDGWANRDLDVGSIVAFAPDLTPFSTLLGVPADTVRQVLRSWGPGKFDAELILDGKTTNPHTGRSAATLIPPAFGLAGVNLHTWTGWGSVTHWNAFVANLEMHGKGTFFDPRLDDATKFPIAAANRFGHIRNTPDLITSKLPALHFYQLALPAPRPPGGSFDIHAARRGEAVFAGKAQCSTCHVPPLFTEPGWNMHTAAEIGIDDFQAKRSPDERYRTAPLKGLWTHQKGGFYHDGRFATLLDVVDHYNRIKQLKLTEQEKGDLIQYLLSL